jgi:hypothetical protein
VAAGRNVRRYIDLFGSWTIVRRVDIDAVSDGGRPRELPYLTAAGNRGFLTGSGDITGGVKLVLVTGCHGTLSVRATTRIAFNSNRPITRPAQVSGYALWSLPVNKRIQIHGAIGVSHDWSSASHLSFLWGGGLDVAATRRFVPRANLVGAISSGNTRVRKICETQYGFSVRLSKVTLTPYLTEQLNNPGNRSMLRRTGMNLVLSLQLGGRR